MGTKNNPGDYDCYAELGDDEPYFLLRAKDVHGPEAVRLWAAERRRLIDIGAKPLEDLAKVREALQCATDMEAWLAGQPVT